jgi:hypothetical protein
MVPRQPGFSARVTITDSSDSNGVPVERVREKPAKFLFVVVFTFRRMLIAENPGLLSA